ncbi:MAG: hypothetical protein AABZ80_13025 [Gemmatimonadota bacterium]
MRPHYDFSNGRRGEFFEQYWEGTNTVRLDADVHAVFGDSRAVNEALRTLIRVAGKPPRARSHRSKTR